MVDAQKIEETEKRGEQSATRLYPSARLRVNSLQRDRAILARKQIKRHKLFAHLAQETTRLLYPC